MNGIPLGDKYTEAARRSLIFCSAGSRINQLEWLQGLTDFNVALVYYAEQNVTPPKSKYYLQNKDYKIPNFLEITRKYPEVLSYDYYFFIDDDIVFSSPCFDEWLKSIVDNQLDISQPALSAESKADWPHLIRQEWLNVDVGQFIEVQCFALSRKALRYALPFFFMAKTGTGLDIAIYFLGRRHGLRSAVLHNLSILHPHRPREHTVRKQFNEFSKFNSQLSRYIEFCFDEQDALDNLAQASTSLGDTRGKFVRIIGIGRFILRRIRRKILRFFSVT